MWNRMWGNRGTYEAEGLVPSDGCSTPSVSNVAGDTHGGLIYGPFCRPSYHTLGNTSSHN